MREYTCTCICVSTCTRKLVHGTGKTQKTQEDSLVFVCVYVCVCVCVCMCESVCVCMYSVYTCTLQRSAFRERIEEFITMRHHLRQWAVSTHITMRSHL